MEQNYTAVGWLIKHTETMETLSFPLKIGKNQIGRKTTDHNPDIMVENDNYISRNHAIIVVKINEKSEFEYLLVDNAELQGKPSLNGTYLNGNPERIGDKPVKLSDGDTIQTGLTKFVLKTSKVAINVDDELHKHHSN